MSKIIKYKGEKKGIVKTVNVPDDAYDFIINGVYLEYKIMMGIGIPLTHAIHIDIDEKDNAIILK